MHTVAKCESSESLSHAHSDQLPLVDQCDLTSTSQPMLGVLFFPKAPQATKEPHTQYQRTASTHLASQGRATTRYSSWVSQLPQDKSIKTKILQRNVMHKISDPYPSSSIIFIEFLSRFFPKFPFN